MSFASTEWVKDLLKKVTKKTTLQPGRIDGVLYQNDIPMVLTKSINVYLDASGNDTTGDGTQAHPFKTFKGLMAYLPKEAMGYSNRVNIYISGNYTNVEFGCLAYINYLVYVYFNNLTMTYNASYKGSQSPFWFEGCAQVWIESGDLTVDSSELTSINNFYAVYFRATNARITSANITVNGHRDTTYHQAGIAAQRSNLYLAGTQTISHCYWGCYFLQASHVFINNIAGSDNSTGIFAAHGSYCGLNASYYFITGSKKDEAFTGSTIKSS